MVNYILFDDKSWNTLLPLTFTRPVCEIRIGILTIREKWERALQTTCSFLTQDYLRAKYPIAYGNTNIFLNGSVLPDCNLISFVNELKPGQGLVQDQKLIAFNTGGIAITSLPDPDEITASIPYQNEIISIEYPWQIFEKNGIALRSDFETLTKGRVSEPISETNRVAGLSDIFLEKGAKVEFSTINATSGPVYIGKDAEIMEGAIIRGPFALCEQATVKMGAKIYGPTTLGPHCKVGGEVNNSVLFGYSNKAHDGFLGNAVLGEWCNLGADTNNSNLKNNYEPVKIWSYVEERFISTGLQFCGLIMGDHSKSGINTMFNTGTVVGVSANIFGAGFPRNFIPSFSWGGNQGYMVYKTDNALKTAGLVLERRGLALDAVEKNILIRVFEMDEKYRRF